ncbi:hypothetical protein [Pseudooceanicola nitratireducens]|uniref:hypothetical protein n=1 Tax=Pseudooceanicola nitratireducens TaxID=517719 RepID=UPI00111404E2|nr:hypothetical protein [Pseudooceanicola nitratireducens]
MPAPRITAAAARQALEGAIAAGLTPTAAVWLADGSYRLEFSSQELKPGQDVAANDAGKPKKWGEKS